MTSHCERIHSLEERERDDVDNGDGVGDRCVYEPRLYLVNVLGNKIFGKRFATIWNSSVVRWKCGRAEGWSGEVS